MKILASNSAYKRPAAVVGPAMALLSTAVLVSGCLGSTQTSDIGPNGACTSSGCHTLTGGDGGPGSNCSSNGDPGGNGAGQGGNGGQGVKGGDNGGNGGQGINGGGNGGQGINVGSNGGQGSNGGNGVDARGGDGAPGSC